MAHPRHPLKAEEEFKLATGLRKELRKSLRTSASQGVSVYSTAVTRLIDNCRIALIQYLLNHESMKALHIVDADSLFELFLIDV